MVKVTVRSIEPLTKKAPSGFTINSAASAFTRIGFFDACGFELSLPFLFKTGFSAGADGQNTRISPRTLSAHNLWVLKGWEFRV